MILDSSAVVAMVFDEPHADALFEAASSADVPLLPAPNAVETYMVIDGKGSPQLSRRLDSLLCDLGVEVVSFTAEHARVARQAFRDYGRGSGHPARLNYGDCCAYAVAQVAREPLLFVGDDFTHTDVEPALP